MNRKKDLPLFAAVALLVLLVCGLLIRNSLPNTPHLQLPEAGASSSAAEDPSGEEDTLIRVEVTPETVQDVIATLERPTDYTRSITTETIWSGGSSRTELTVTLSRGWTRVDAVLPSGTTRHSITDGETTYVWYDSSLSYFTGKAGDISSDNEQHIPTYEDILTLPVEEIAAADYRNLSDIYCIYVETVPDENGYVLRYWVEVDTGLLIASEWLQDGATVYRMGSPTADSANITEERFTLPDGTVLHSPNA
ncbi:hypothetical protein KQI82_09105 [Oscillibacter sp. MSJ-2]|uniref:MucB/RseB N-terminal domain-containing protein n=1 Tax=Dysosmobacter acutus TaxID=2841504 RepID=A0ABS6F9U3_9FIRM|nr:hypothetical protein [Dysosmobacter acutus]